MLVYGVFRPIVIAEPRSFPCHRPSAEECHSVSWTTRVPRRRLSSKNIYYTLIPRNGLIV